MALTLTTIYKHQMLFYVPYNVLKYFGSDVNKIDVNARFLMIN